MDIFTYQKSNFDEVKEIWKNHLWSARTSPIEEVSAIDKNGNIDMELMKASAVFIKCIDNKGEIVGVVSGFKTSSDEFRSRGIWVNEQYRDNKIGSGLMKQIETAAIEMGCKTMWSMPRKTSWPFYEKNNFKKVKEINHFEYAPHYITEKAL